MLAKLCRLAIGASIVFGYPLTFVGIRDGVLNLAGIKKVGDRQGRRKGAYITPRQSRTPNPRNAMHTHPPQQ